MKYHLILVFFLLVCQAFSQVKTIYLVKEKYKPNVLQTLDGSSIKYEEVKMLGTKSITSKDNKEVNLEAVKINLIKLFPDKNAEGLLCIDLENHSFKKLKGHNIVTHKKVSDKEYEKALNEYIQVVEFVKKNRPNLKVGVFELPFRIFDMSQLRKNSSKLLDPILSKVDVIFPSFYIPHKSEQKAKKFLDTNLKMVFDYADRLNKPVIPFIWYMLFSNEKEDRYEMIPKNVMYEYIQSLEQYKSPSGNGISGFVWWEEYKPFYKNNNWVKQNLLHARDQRSSWTREEALKYYFGK